MPPRVRFVDDTDNQVFRYSPNSPTSTSSTLSSSPGPVTPPSPLTVTLPSTSASTATKSVLSFHADLRLNPRLACRFDLSVDPRTLPFFRTGEHFASIQDEDATIPPTRCLEVWCRWLPSVIDITPSTGQYVTVQDVVYGLYDALRTKISDSQYQLCTDPKKFPGIRPEVDNAFKARCDKLMERNVGEAEKERRKGRRLVDMLRGQNVFYGLSIDPGTGFVKFSVRKT
ncbi:hypothetical protein K435DRAFT_490602 [Dendrothele bispora CBS 962.96]|uniref:DUF6699 domain-containing protein n=1 Tax=Dendrothele bispora (strain CBS 962.96) TaxID=1314807 RepID=A0A4S8MAW7_DENBC|nr:hypothetical protein K435DRAFT_490602 [Dendrothele bispora CBS 962.96]